MAKRKTMSAPLTFSDLAVGDKFIDFPVDGDDSGHGGFRGKHRIFIKVSNDPNPQHWNAMTISDGQISHMPDGMKVIEVA